MICLDFLFRESPRHHELVSDALQRCRFLAVPSLTPHYTQGEFAAKAWEEARHYERPVLFYRRVRGGTQRWGKCKSLPSALLRVLRGGILFGSFPEESKQSIFLLFRRGQPSPAATPVDYNGTWIEASSVKGVLWPIIRTNTSVLQSSTLKITAGR